MLGIFHRLKFNLHFWCGFLLPRKEKNIVRVINVKTNTCFCANHKHTSCKSVLAAVFLISVYQLRVSSVIVWLCWRRWTLLSESAWPVCFVGSCLGTWRCFHRRCCQNNSAVCLSPYWFPCRLLWRCFVPLSSVDAMNGHTHTVFERCFRSVSWKIGSLQELNEKIDGALVSVL